MMKELDQALSTVDKFSTTGIIKEVNLDNFFFRKSRVSVMEVEKILSIIGDILEVGQL